MRVPSSCRLAAAIAVSCGALGASAALFEPLFVAGKVVGQVRVVRPDGSTGLLKESHAYPYGTRIEVPESLTAAELRAAEKSGAEVTRPQALVVLASDFRFRVGPGSKLVVLDDPVVLEDGTTAERKTLSLEEGAVSTLLTAPAAKPAEGEAAPVVDPVVVRTPLCDAVALADQNQIRVVRRQDSGWTCQFAAPTGKLQLVGRQFKVQRLKRNTEVEVSGTEDFTRIYAPRGEFHVAFEKGADAVENVFFKTRTIGKIWRSYASVGSRMAVSVMVAFPSTKADAEGDILTYSYLEGQTGVGVDGAAQAAPGAAGAEAADGEGDSADGFSAGDDDGFGDFGDDSASSNNTNDNSAFAGFDDW